MAKPIDTESIDVDLVDINLEQETTEIIELAVEGIEALTRAFDIINEVCQERDNPAISFDPPHRVVVN